jgi:hypothetical protein
MAYTHSRYEVEMQRVDHISAVGGATVLGAAGVALITTVAAEWGPGYVPHRIRGAALILSGTDGRGAYTGAAVEASFEADISTPGTVTKLFGIGVPSAAAENRSLYHTPTYVITINPGTKIQFRCTTAATAGVRARVMLYVEPVWEEPANITGMQNST